MKRVVNFRFAAFCAVGAIAGVFFGRLATDSLLVCILLPSVVAAGGVLLFLWKKKTFVLALCLCFAVGCAVSILDFYTTDARVFTDECVVKGRVKTEEAKGFILSDVTVDGEDLNGDVYVRTKESAEIGDKVKLKGYVKTYADDPFSTYNALRYADGVYYYVDRPTFSYVTEGNPTIFERLRRRVLDAQEENLSQEDAGVLKSLLFGDKSDISSEDKSSIARIGLSHVLAVSGLHVGFLAGIILWITKKLRAPRFVGALLTALAVIGYGLLTGFPAGVKRVGIVLAVGFLAKLAGRKADPPTTLAVAGAICALITPRELFDVGFLMSFGASFGLICFYRPLLNALTQKIRLRIVGKPIRYLIGVVCATAAANVAILPVSVVAFRNFTPYAVIGNLLVLPIVSVLFPYAMIASGLCAVWGGFGVLLKGCSYLLVAVRAVTEAVGSLPYAVFTLKSVPVFCWVVYAFTFFAVSPYALIDKRAKAQIAFLGGGSVFAMLFWG